MDVGKPNEGPLPSPTCDCAFRWRPIHDSANASKWRRPNSECRRQCFHAADRRPQRLGQIVERCTAGRIRFAGQSDRKSTRLNSSHVEISYAVFCLKKKKKNK